MIRDDGKTEYTFNDEGKPLVITNPRVDKLPDLTEPQPEMVEGPAVKT